MLPPCVAIVQGACLPLTSPSASLTLPSCSDAKYQNVDGELWDYSWRLSTRGSSKYLQSQYRTPLAMLDYAGALAASATFVNSEFTRGVAADEWPLLAPWLEVLHPVAHAPAQRPVGRALRLGRAALARPVFLSVNRFERRKRLAVAIEALAQVGRERAQLVLAGGFDPQNRENHEHVAELEALCASKKLELTVHRVNGRDPADEPWRLDADVVLVTSFNDAQRAQLLERCVALVYTPVREHFGITPLEAMMASRPVIACASGGPLETVVEGETGWLVGAPFGAGEVAAAFAAVLEDPQRAKAYGEAGAQRAEAMFGWARFAGQVENALSQ